MIRITAVTRGFKLKAFAFNKVPHSDRWIQMVANDEKVK